MNMPTDAQPPALVPAELVAAIRSARRIVVLTGAGMSAESGIPTFRDALAGLWARFDPEQLATEAGFKRDPALVWGWYEARRRGVMRTQPNPGHHALRDLARCGWLEDLTIVTQNVDDLHERAGSTNVIRLHGSLFAPRCLACGSAPAATAPEEPQDMDADALDQSVPPPRCPKCGGPIRPGVVWFDEQLPTREWSQAVKRVEQADLLLIVGTSGRVYPAASLPEITEGKGRPVWVVDPDPGLATRSREQWRSTAAAALPALVLACAAAAG